MPTVPRVAEDTILQRFSTGEWASPSWASYIVIALGVFYRRRIHVADDLVVAGRTLSYILNGPVHPGDLDLRGALMGAGGYRLIVLSGGIQLATIVAAYVLGFFWKKAAS